MVNLYLSNDEQLILWLIDSIEYDAAILIYVVPFYGIFCFKPALQNYYFNLWYALMISSHAHCYFIVIPMPNEKSKLVYGKISSYFLLFYFVV